MSETNANPANKTAESLGFKLPLVNAPATLEELVAKLGADTVYQLAFSNRLFRTVLPRARVLIVEKLSEATGIKPLVEVVTEPQPDGSVETEEVPIENDKKFVARVLASQDKKHADFQPLFDSVQLDFLAEPVRKPAAPKGPGKTYIALAERLLARGEAVVAQAISNLQAKNAGLVVEPTVESLAAAIRANTERVQKEEESALGIGA